MDDNINMSFISSLSTVKNLMMQTLLKLLVFIILPLRLLHGCLSSHRYQQSKSSWWGLPLKHLVFIILLWHSVKTQNSQVECQLDQVLAGSRSFALQDCCMAFGSGSCDGTPITIVQDDIAWGGKSGKLEIVFQLWNWFIANLLIRGKGQKLLMWWYTNHCSTGWHCEGIQYVLRDAIYCI
jgi:hypothetical protein